MAKGQIQLSKLIFTQSWEDPDSDRKALRITKNDTLLTITSGGCNTLNFLLQDPKVIYAVDINPTQSFLLELKIAAMRNFTFSEFLEFLGLRFTEKRKQMYKAINNQLSSDAIAYWNLNMAMLEKGILGKGRYESFISLFRKILNYLQGRKRIEGLFKSETLEEQKRYFDEVWNTNRWRAIFKIFFNKIILAKRGLSSDYFEFDDGSASFAESFFRRSKRAMTELPVSNNYFLAQYLLGRYRSDKDAPDYLRPEYYDTIRSRLGRIEVITADAKAWLSAHPPRSIDCFSLSNICEVMDHQETDYTFEAVARASVEGARICFRNLMIPRNVPDRLKNKIKCVEKLSKDLIETDRSFVYSRVDALQVQ